MEAQSIVTGIDAFLKYISEHGEVTSIDAATQLKVSEDTIENWAKILEKANLVKITYKMGRMYLSQVGTTPQKAVEQVKEIEIKSTIAINEASAQLNLLNSISSRIDELSGTMSGADDLFKKKIKPIKNSIDSIDKMQSEVASKYNNIKSGKEAIETLEKQITQEMANLRADQEVIKAVSFDTGNAKTIIEDLRNKAKDAEQNAKTLISKFNADVEAQKKNLVNLSNSVKEESKMLRAIADGAEKQLNEYERKARLYSEQASVISSKTEHDKRKITDEISRSASETRKIYEIATDEVQKATKLLDDSKQNFGEFTTFFNKINEIKTGLNEAKQEKDSLQKELNTILEQLRNLGQDGKNEQPVSAAGSNLVKTSERTGALSKKISKLKSDLEENVKSKKPKQ
jgi:DNA repair exonuclease SbcCD ATPase subunit